MKLDIRIVGLGLVALASSACTVVHGAGEWLGIACEWVEWQHMDPAAPTAPTPVNAGPDDETCYMTWANSGRVVLASPGDSHDTISCNERDDSNYSEEDPLVVRPGQIAWIFGTYSADPDVIIVIATCAELDAWVDAGGTPAELARTKTEERSM